MLVLIQPLAICSIFILFVMCILSFIAVFYICKNHYERVEIELMHVRMKPEEVARKSKITQKEAFMAVEMDVPLYSTQNLPQIMLANEELPPEYAELESARASPLPSYDDVMYCEQLNRSFQNLLSAT
ncbi:unnamed protein product [Caenorhabditis bovis]|uniref:Uncharacterized protein n=1 Tax=Caenorhabditis bovis TaxID=2654633 RepID=A0A8S1EFL8_9PELO|nr:unnamed protein product [Caenorhabditis bovis]